MKLLFLSLLLMIGLGAQAQTVVETGVAKTLAEYRAATITNLKYQLTFVLPANKRNAVTGDETIRFTLSQEGSANDVVLDFRVPDDHLKSVRVNGTPLSINGAQTSTNCRFEKEHIILPAAQMKTGENEVKISFVADDQSLNRSNDYLYTIFVPDRARTVFPCLDQPDLKARYSLTLQVPAGWRAVGNSPLATGAAEPSASPTTLRFKETEPLPTYLFAFAAGKFSYKTWTANGRTIGAYYRETDPKRIAQLPVIFRQVAYALKWQEDFTGAKYPFAKYDLVILPGFQFGGMEHTGATFYNDSRIFLNDNPTKDEELSRASLIAHETSHMWFGDYVTMKWFDDVWTKEVFANYFAAEIVAPQFPTVNHDLNRLKTFTAAAMSEDRTWRTPLVLDNGEVIRGGGTAIHQDLDNLQNAGLIYNNIIYNKAPLVMNKLVDIMGRDAFREGIREYVQTYAYGNATWDDLVTILDRHTDADLRRFSQAWVNAKGMPSITFRYKEYDDLDIRSNGNLKRHILVAEQHSPYQNEVLWPQTFEVTLHRADADTAIVVRMSDTESFTNIPIPEEWSDVQILPNTDGKGYGLFLLEENQLEGLICNWQTLTTGTARQSVLMALHENYMAHNISNGVWLNLLLAALEKETDELTASTLVGYLYDPILRLGKGGDNAVIQSSNFPMFQQRSRVEAQLRELAEHHNLKSCRQQIIRLLCSCFVERETQQWIYKIWEEGKHPLLSERDYMKMSYELALLIPEHAESILARQRERIGNADRLREFDYVSRAVLPYRHGIDALFDQLLEPENRRIEPWARTAMSYIHHPLRDYWSIGYVTPGLEELEEVQRTGDIFFPGQWSMALLAGHRDTDVRRKVVEFLNAHPDYPVLLRNKILNACFNLFW